jgi:organic radical activating enzyme
VFGKNEIVGKKHFAGIDSAHLMVTSLFKTIQGEGPFAGQVAWFLRLSKCNLACSFCDTYFDSGDFMTYDDITEKLRELGPTKLLVVTGGEPMLQGAKLNQFLRQLDYALLGIKVQVETNGLIPLHDLPWSVCVVVSPKCFERNGKPDHYLKPAHDNLRRANHLKFLISGDIDSSYHTVPDWAFTWAMHNGGSIFVSPMAEYLREPAKASDTLEQRVITERVSFWQEGLFDKEKMQRNYEYAAQYCLENNFRLSIQSHLFASLP